MTSFLFSKLFYGIEIWQYNILNFESKRKLNSFYYNSCRVIINDFEKLVNRETIDELVKRATPEEYSNFSVARTVIKSMHLSNSPLFQICSTTSYQTQRKPNQYFFYDNSRSRVGKNSINNRAGEIFKQINFEFLNINRDLVRIKLKRTFFRYAN